MLRPAVRLRFGVRGLVAAAAITLLSACAAGPGQPEAGGPSSAPAPVAPARLTHALPDDPARMFLPATGAETRWTQGLDVFARQVSQAAASACARERGFGLPEQPRPAYIRFSELPDLDFLTRHGFARSAEVPVPAAAPGADRSGNPGSPEAVRGCHAVGKAAADTLRDAYAPLQGRWFHQLAALRRAPAVTRALSALPDCFAEHGVRARDEDGFFAAVDTALSSAPSADLLRVDRELGRTYAACMRPVEAVREPARLRLRSRFLVDHADEIGEVRRTLVPSLRRAADKHGVRLAFPAP
ncbi:hypothetical protein [Streptomyces apricus]|uniref:Lipoprotein n=1 Tax=Streptomyces apricus TaxID=1828112 RepID=A0A5B0A6N2_9ACTN|nr:hypothetical protein [Streptomyces apricus]KAA0925618.1 hypothetical protein FGF04_32770 [Streptomyces apricus]